MESKETPGRDKTDQREGPTEGLKTTRKASKAKETDRQRYGIFEEESGRQMRNLREELGLDEQEGRPDPPGLENKPPLGLKPKYLHDRQRQNEIIEAINRYTEARKVIPLDWIAEYNQLARK